MPPSDQVAVPAHHCVRAYQQPHPAKRRRPQSVQQRRQQGPIRGGEPHSPSAQVAFQHRDLMPQDQDLDVLVPIARREKTQDRERGRHRQVGQSQQHTRASCRDDGYLAVTVSRAVSGPKPQPPEHRPYASPTCTDEIFGIRNVDRSLKQAELLQAVARVNRTAEHKTCGYVVDYYGVANHLQEALKAYAAEDIEGALKDLKDEIAKLEPQRRRIRMLFTDRGVTPEATALVKEQCVQLLADPQLFDRFEVELRKFLSTVDKVLPRPDVKPYIPDARLFAEIQLRARRRYRIDDGEFDPSLYGEKVRELIDQHLESLGIEQLLPPVSLTADDFREKVAKLPGARARASEMEHAIRHHIEVNFGKDPHRYRLLSERLAEILRQHQDDWEQQIYALSDLLADLERDQPAEDDPLTPVERALYGVLLEETATDGIVDKTTDKRLVDFSTKIQNVAVETIHRRDFWRRQVDQRDFTKDIAQRLIVDDICDPVQAAALADKLFDVIRHNRQRIPRP
jgi:type I restriction enzyme R subunit